MAFSASSCNESWAKAIADAFATAYIANRKNFDVSRLRGAEAAVATKLAAVQTTIDSLNAAGAACVPSNCNTVPSSPASSIALMRRFAGCRRRF